MRYLVKARLKPGCEGALLEAIADGTLGQGSVAGDEYLHDLEQARLEEKLQAAGCPFLQRSKKPIRRSRKPAPRRQSSACASAAGRSTAGRCST